MSERKTFIIDTNVLVTDTNSLNSFENSDLILPFTTIEELDKLKSRPSEVGANARETARWLSELIDTKNPGVLRKGIEIGNGNTLKVALISDFEFDENLSEDWDRTSKDNQIIDICRGLARQYKEDGLEPPVLVTRDIILKVKCDILGIACSDYLKEGEDFLAKEAEHIYTGICKINVPSEIIQQYWETYSSPEKEFAHELLKKYIKGQNLHPNQFVVLNDSTSSSETQPILRYLGENKPFKIIKERKTPICNIMPRNKEQMLAMELLMDDSIKLVTLTGKAGTGKSLCSLACGLEQVLEKKKYKSLCILRPIVPVGNDIGFIPGNKEEKLDPWMGAIKDNIKYLLFSSGRKSSKNNEMTFQMLQDEGIIELEAITYLRGRSIANAFIIIAEAQNLTPHELKTIITRVGENTKIVVEGDIEQTDSIYLDSVNNGLSMAVEKFKQYDISGHCSLVRGERSKLASLAAQILNS